MLPNNHLADALLRITDAIVFLMTSSFHYYLIRLPKFLKRKLQHKRQKYRKDTKIMSHKRCENTQQTPENRSTQNLCICQGIEGTYGYVFLRKRSSILK